MTKIKQALLYKAFNDQYWHPYASKKCKTKLKISLRCLFQKHFNINFLSA